VIDPKVLLLLSTGTLLLLNGLIARAHAAKQARVARLRAEAQPEWVLSPPTEDETPQA
jgi:hypothetical protein